jgi:hypothetical protein
MLPRGIYNITATRVKKYVQDIFPRDRRRDRPVVPVFEFRGLRSCFFGTTAPNNLCKSKRPSRTCTFETAVSQIRVVRCQKLDTRCSLNPTTSTAHLMKCLVFVDSRWQHRSIAFPTSWLRTISIVYYVSIFLVSWISHAVFTEPHNI